MRTENASEVGTHVFQRAGLGLAPFRFDGMSENAITYPDGSSKARNLQPAGRFPEQNKTETKCMKTNRSLYALESKINAHLSTLQPEARPEMPNIRGHRVQSVAVIARGFEALDGNGNAACITIDQALSWLRKPE